MKLPPFPNPRELVRRWEGGELEREEMQRLMREHQVRVLEEAEEYHRNPMRGWMETFVNRRAARKLVKEHGEGAVRELLVAMSWLEDFPPSAYLWNADHWDVSLHAFLRSKMEPVFRVKESWVRSGRARLLVEYGVGGGELLRERF